MGDTAHAPSHEQDITEHVLRELQGVNGHAFGRDFSKQSREKIEALTKQKTQANLQDEITLERLANESRFALADLALLDGYLEAMRLLQGINTSELAYMAATLISSIVGHVKALQEA